MRIATLGPKGTYSEKAVRQYDGKAEIVFCSTISEAIEAVKEEKADLAIVPTENSLLGSVDLTLDLLRNVKENNMYIAGEEIVRIKLCLLIKGDIKDVAMIYSKKEAFPQCRIYIKDNFPNVKIYEADSTAEAARYALLANSTAAIASCEAAQEYGLKIYAENIQDKKNNYTSFIIIGKKNSQPTGNDKTSFIVYPEGNWQGVYYEILGAIAKRGIDLTRVESRPTQEKLGEYVFYFDVKGHHLDPDLKIQDAIQAIKNMGHGVEVLGSYPAGQYKE